MGLFLYLCKAAKFLTWESVPSLNYFRYFTALFYIDDNVHQKAEEPGSEAQDCNPSTWKLRQEDYSEFEVNLSMTWKGVAVVVVGGENYTCKYLMLMYITLLV